MLVPHSQSLLPSVIIMQNIVMVPKRLSFPAGVSIADKETFLDVTCLLTKLKAILTRIFSLFLVRYMIQIGLFVIHRSPNDALLYSLTVL